jgi:hypothetical protein
MFVNEVLQEVNKGPVAITPKWIRVKDAARYAAMSRSQLYEALVSGEIKSFTLKSSADAKRGMRLVSIKSIDNYLEGKAKEAEEATAAA